MSRLAALLIFVAIGAALAAPLKVLFVLAPVPVKQSGTDGAKLIAVIPSNTTRLVLKFDKPILARIEKTAEFSAAFQDPGAASKESSVVRLEAIGELKRPVIVSVKDGKTGDAVKVLVKVEENA
ncbi:unnamed protein product [Caenorhabditis sp. 36 PRJEB53466]|nr:unnamed protein product [Caenorhabditis sp. 36 PRJEB53466]